MPANLTTRQKENTKKHIQVSMILKRLVKHTLGDEEIMTASQVNAAKILLGKVLPDMKAMEAIIEVRDKEAELKQANETLRAAGIDPASIQPGIH